MPSDQKAIVVSHHEDYTVGQTTGGLSVFFTILCIVDLFGVFPVVALPKPIIACGAYGIPLVVSVFALQIYTALLLGRCWILAQELAPQIGEKNRYPYPAVAELAFGRRARQAVIFLIDATVFGAGVPNLIVASQSLQLFWWKITGGGVGISFCVWMLVVGLLLCPVMWLGSPKDMKPLALTSVCIVATVALATWSCILQDVSSPPPSELLKDQPDPRNFLVAYGIIAFQFDIHPMLLTIQVDMKDSSKISLAVIGGFVVTAAIFAITSLLAANRYGQNVNSNILQGIPASIPLYIVALLVTVQLCLSSAVGNSALFQHVEDLLGVPRDFCLRRCLVRSSIIVLAVFLGESVPRFDLVMGLVGSTLTGPLMFILPPLFFLKLCRMKTQRKGEKMILIQKNTQLSKHGKESYNPSNGISHAIQNSDDNFPLITQYKTFSNIYPDFNTDYHACDHKIKCCDMLLAFSVMVLGVIATLVATYSNWADAINYASFAPPCIINATAAAMIVLPIST